MYIWICQLLSVSSFLITLAWQGAITVLVHISEYLLTASFLIFMLFIGAAIKIYFKLTTGWCKSQQCLVGKTVIVTGANTGIGYQTALDFAKRGARVILACRDENRAEIARTRIVEETENQNIIVRLIDMSSFRTVRSFAKTINETESRLDILVNNAGAGVFGDKRSRDGHPLNMQINYFSSFLLTHLLIGLMKKTGQGRIINVGSIVAKYAYGFVPDDIDKNPKYNMSYSHSKLCNILFTIELAEKLKGTGITTYSVHPGFVKTEIFRHFRGPIAWAIDAGMNIFSKTSEEGAQTTIYCSLQKEIEKFSGGYFVDCQRVPLYKTATVPQLPDKLWKITQDIVHLAPEESCL